MAITRYEDDEGRKIGFEVASSFVELPEVSEREWAAAYNQGSLASLTVSAGGVVVNRYEGFHLDVDTRRVNSQREVDVDLARLLPPFVCVSVLFGTQDTFTHFSIGPHMDDTVELSVAMQLGELTRLHPALLGTEIAKDIPFEMCLREPQLLHIAPEQHLYCEGVWEAAWATIAHQKGQGRAFWPVALKIEPLPSAALSEVLSCRSTWTQRLGQALFTVERLVSKLCPEASMAGRFAKIVNLCLWLFQYSEGMAITSETEDDLNGGPARALREICGGWWAWSLIHALEMEHSVPGWTVDHIGDLRSALGDPIFDAVNPAFVHRSISAEQLAVLEALRVQQNLAYNPLAVLGSTVASATVESAVFGAGVRRCKNAKAVVQQDGFVAVTQCGRVMVKATKDAPELPEFCAGGVCTFTGQDSLKQIWDRQSQVNACIGHEQRFGPQPGPDCRPISDLWALANGYLHIVDRYFKDQSLPFLASIPPGVSVKLLMSDDDHQGPARRAALKAALIQNPMPNLEIRVVTCQGGTGAHPLHDRYVFSSDWGASISSSLQAVGSNALWAFKIVDHRTLCQHYFDYYWSQPIGVPFAAGSRTATVTAL